MLTVFLFISRSKAIPTQYSTFFNALDFPFGRKFLDWSPKFQFNLFLAGKRKAPQGRTCLDYWTISADLTILILNKRLRDPTSTVTLASLISAFWLVLQASLSVTSGSDSLSSCLPTCQSTWLRVYLVEQLIVLLSVHLSHALFRFPVDFFPSDWILSMIDLPFECFRFR